MKKLKITFDAHMECSDIGSDEEIIAIINAPIEVLEKHMKDILIEDEEFDIVNISNLFVEVQDIESKIS